MRGWFAAEGFVEVETPILQVAPGAEVHLAGFATDWETPDGEERERWLHSSPEFAMKKLLAGGVPQAVPVRPRVPQRRGLGAASSRVHHARMVSRRRGLRDDHGGLRGAAGADRREGAALAGQAVCDPAAAPERLTVAEAFERYAGVDLFATVGERREARAACRAWRCMPAIPGTTSSSASCSTRSSPSWASAGRPSCASTRSRWRRWPAPSRAIRGSPSASSSMPAASSLPTPSAS